MQYFFTPTGATRQMLQGRFTHSATWYDISELDGLRPVARRLVLQRELAKRGPHGIVRHWETRHVLQSVEEDTP